METRVWSACIFQSQIVPHARPDAGLGVLDPRDDQRPRRGGGRESANPGTDLYTGLTNLPLAGAVVSGDPGWGCCQRWEDLLDGRIQYPNWSFGYALAGGGNRWGGGVPGWKQLTVDLETPQTVARVDWWPHDANNVPTAWKVEVSNDGTPSLTCSRPRSPGVVWRPRRSIVIGCPQLWPQCPFSARDRTVRPL